MKYCPKCNTQNSEEASICVSCGTALSQSQASGTNTGYSGSTSYQAPLSMKWFYFIIYVQLFLAAVLNVVNGIPMLSGSQYNGGGATASQVYALFNGLQAVDIMCGLSQLAMAVAAIVVRMRLAHYRKNAPKQYLLLLAANIAIVLLYAMIASSITGINLFDNTIITQLLANAAMIVVNYTYFKKRDMMFTD